MSFPVHDWQFWVITVIALAAAVFVLRMILPSSWVRRKPKGKATTLTVGGKAVDRKKTKG